MIPFVTIGQKLVVKGNIIAGKEAAAGASVVEKGTNNAVISDLNGSFEITVSSAEAVLEISFVGYKKTEIQVSGKPIIEVVLESETKSMSQVVISGFAGVAGKARKRTESIQRTPESVTALDSKAIERAGISNLTDFAKLVPNMKLNSSQAAGINFLTIRGIPQIRNSDAPVAFVIDGVTIPDPSLLNQDLFDLALVEVVKGPQGALYGKNAIGGAVNIYTKEPTNVSKNAITVGYGNGNSWIGQFLSSGAIDRSKLFYRLSAQAKSFDGLLTNQFLKKKVDFNRNYTVRGQLIYKITNNLKASGTLQYADNNAGAAYYSVNPTGNVFLPGEPGGVLSPDPVKGNNIISLDEPGKSAIKNTFANINLEYNSGKVKVQTITSYNYVNRSLSGDLDFTPAPDFTQGEKATTTTFNLELRISNTNSNAKLNWSAGGFYQTIRKPFFQDGLARDFNSNTLNYAVTADVINNTKTLALFGFADYKITSKLTASAGFRFDNDEFKQLDNLFELSSARKNNIFQPKLSLSYQATDAALIYANYGRGYRAGGFNPAQTERFNRDYKDELSDNYELGVKTAWWDNRLILNASAFYNSFSNQQQYIFDVASFYVGNYNYDKSRITGIEVDAKLRLSKYLDFLANYGFVNSEITKGGATGGTNGNATDLSSFNGKKTPIVPQSSFNIGFESGFALSKKVNFEGRINLNGTGKIYWNESNDPAATSKGYQLLDARVGIELQKFKFSLWGQNILDKQYYTEFVYGKSFGLTDDFGWRGVPATYGFTLSFNF